LWLEEKGKKVPESEKIYCNFCNPVRQAIVEAEVNKVTFYDWLKRGKKEKSHFYTSYTL